MCQYRIPCDILCTCAYNARVHMESLFDDVQAGPVVVYVQCNRNRIQTDSGAASMQAMVQHGSILLAPCELYSLHGCLCAAFTLHKALP